jgi:hypothetical protein
MQRQGTQHPAHEPAISSIRAETARDATPEAGCKNTDTTEPSSLMIWANHVMGEGGFPSDPGI